MNVTTNYRAVPWGRWIKRGLKPSDHPTIADAIACFSSIEEGVSMEIYCDGLAFFKDDRILATISSYLVETQPNPNPNP